MNISELKSNRVMGLFAHPDDCEILAAGTVALLQRKGFEVSIVTVATGDMGTAIMSSQEISRVRFQEATKSASILNGKYYCLGESDVKFSLTVKLREKAVEVVRRINPLIIFANSPQDYMLDHCISSDLAWDVCFNAAIPNYVTNEPNPAKPTDFIPYLYYADPLEGVDRLGNRIHPEFYIDISKSMATKISMLIQHDSQRSWLKKQHGLDHYVESMKDWCRRRGQEVGVEYAEAFRQHRGHAFPHDNLLDALLGALKNDKAKK